MSEFLPNRPANPGPTLSDPDRALRLGRWLLEESREYADSTSHAERLDALFDLLGLVILELGSVPPLDLVNAHAAYEEAQSRRARPLTFHHTLISQLVTAIMSCQPPRPFRLATWSGILNAKYPTTLRSRPPSR